MKKKSKKCTAKYYGQCNVIVVCFKSCSFEIPGIKICLLFSFSFSVISIIHLISGLSLAHTTVFIRKTKYKIVWRVVFVVGGMY